MSGTILRRRDRTARPPRVEHYSSAVNRGNGLPIIDKLMGTFHDGSEEAHERMN